MLGFEGFEFGESIGFLSAEGGELRSGFLTFNRGGNVDGGGAQEGDVGVAFFCGEGEALFEAGSQEGGAFGANWVVDVGVGGEDGEEAGGGFDFVGEEVGCVGGGVEIAVGAAVSCLL